MDQRERYNDPEEALRIGLESAQVRIWTALPGVIHSFNAEKMTCEVQPTIKAVITDEEGNAQSVALPMLLDCPVVWQGGGGVTLTFPIKTDDECLVVFASRCIDSWWQQGGIQEQAELRMHDLSDGFVLCGVRSQPRVYAVDTDNAQLRTDDGAAFVEINPTSKRIRAHTSGDIVAEADGKITATAQGNIEATSSANITAHATGDMTAQAGGSITMTAAVQISLNAPAIALNGALTSSAGTAGAGAKAVINMPTEINNTLKTTGDANIAGKQFLPHTHSGVQPGGGNTGGVN